MLETCPSQLLLLHINSQTLCLHTCVCGISVDVFPISAKDDKSKKHICQKRRTPLFDSLPRFPASSATLFFTLLAAISIKLAPRVLIAVYEAHLLVQESVFFFVIRHPERPLSSSLRFLRFVLFFLLPPLLSVVFLQPSPSPFPFSTQCCWA